MIVARASCCLVLAASAAFAQKPSKTTQARIDRFLNDGTGAWTPAQVGTMGKLRDAALADPYAYEELRHLTANIGPRLSGSPQAQAAVEYVAAEMRALGATVSLEKTLVPHWVRGEETAALTAWTGGTPGTEQKIVVTALYPTGATPKAGLTAPVLVVGSFAELKALPPDAVRGKILVFNHAFDKQLAAVGEGGQAYEQTVAYRALAPVLGEAAGAAAVLVRSVGGADYRLPHTGAALQGEHLLPAGAVTAEDADLLATLAKQGPVTMRLTLTSQTLPKAESYNVLADWKGSEHPEQVVIVSGHLDSWDLGTGAIDDGAGVVTAMQTVHMMRELNIHPKRTIRFVAWMDEELNSSGAATYAKEHAGEVANHIAALESDLGCDHPFGIAYTGAPALAEYVKPVADALRPIGASLVSKVEEVGPDVDPLVVQGVPGFAPNQDSRTYFNYHHTSADTFDKVDPRRLAENAAVMAVVAYAMADAEQPAPRGPAK